MNKCLRLVAATWLLVSALAVPAFGWGNGGHMAVAFVAYQKLTPQVRSRVDALLKLNPRYKIWLKMIPPNTSAANRKMRLFMIAATWADQIKSDGQHVSDGSHNGNRPPDDGTADLNIGYADRAMHKYWHFVDNPFSQDGASSPTIPVPNAETQIDAFRAVLASNKPDGLKSYDLVWLLHLVGDVHQPLHCAARFGQDQADGDDGGNGVRVVCNPGNPNCGKNLHAFWDDLLGTSNRPSLAIAIGKKLPIASDSSADNLETATWIKESFEAAENKAYVDPPVGLGVGPFTLTSEYHDEALSLAQDRIALAGTRLANILNKELK